MTEEKSNGKGKKILIVEDDSTMRRALSIILDGEGYATEECGDGRSAVERLARIRFDLVVTDLFVPGPDGLEIFERFSGALPVLILTGFLRSPRAEEARKRAGRAFLEKPFSPRVFKERVAEILAAGSEGLIEPGKKKSKHKGEKNG
jgi:CheY-like chemotaxis protein